MPAAATPGPPRLLVAGLSSGVGKTTVVLALSALLRARGLRVATFKCGPDYLDPTWHAQASGQPCHNLDGWMMGREAVLGTFARAAAGADLALIEGMMGLYDGASAETEEGSAAQLAKWLGAPVLAVVDASAMARTIAAVGLGLQQFDPALRLAGLFANRVGGSGHLELLRAACSGTVPVLGGLAAQPELSLPERHLGLHAALGAGSAEAIAGWAARLPELCDVDALLALARSAGPLPAASAEPQKARPAAPRCRIAVARDQAFHFLYEENLHRLETLGAELVFFSPLADPALPAETDGLLLGGGYPELHAARLAQNRSLRGEIGLRARQGMPIYAECGGLMYLCRAIRPVDGPEQPMVDLIPGVAVLEPRLQAIGYATVETTRPTLFGPAGLRLRGHQFRHARLEAAQEAGLQYLVQSSYGGAPFAEGYGQGPLLASWVHLHFASCPPAAEGLVERCAAFRSRR